MPHACSPATVQSLSCSTIPSCELLENTFIPAWKQVPKWGQWQLQLEYEKQKAWFDLKINPETGIFVQTQCPKSFCGSFHSNPAGRTGYRNPMFKSMPWFSIKMPQTSKTNPTAQCEKDSPPEHSLFSVTQELSKEIKAQIKTASGECGHTRPEGFPHLWSEVPPRSNQPARPTAWASTETKTKRTPEPLWSKPFSKLWNPVSSSS